MSQCPDLLAPPHVLPEFWGAEAFVASQCTTCKRGMFDSQPAPQDETFPLPKDNQVYGVYTQMQHHEKQLKKLKASFAQFAEKIGSGTSSKKPANGRGSRAAPDAAGDAWKQVRPEMTKMEEVVSELWQASVGIVKSLKLALREMVGEAERQENLLLQATRNLREKLDAQLKNAAVEKLVAGARTFLKASLNRGPQGEVAVCCSYIAHAETLWDRDPKSMRFALEQHNAVAKWTLLQHRGFLCQMDSCSLTAVFQDVRDCIKFCRELQIKLLDVEWRQSLLAHAETQTVLDTTGQAVFKGLTLAMGVAMGKPDVETDLVTNRLSYSGAPIAAARGLCSLARGGEFAFGPVVLAQLQRTCKYADLKLTMVSQRQAQIDAALRPEQVSFVVPELLAARVGAFANNPEPRPQLLTLESFNVSSKSSQTPRMESGTPSVRGAKGKHRSSDIALSMAERRLNKKILVLQCQIHRMQQDYRDLAEETTILRDRVVSSDFRARSLSLPGPMLHTAGQLHDDTPRAPSAMVISNLQYELAMREKEILRIQIARSREKDDAQKQADLMRTQMKCAAVFKESVGHFTPVQQDFHRLLTRVSQLEFAMDHLRPEVVASELEAFELRHKVWALEQFIDQNKWVTHARKRYEQHVAKGALVDLKERVRVARAAKQREHEADEVEARARTLAAARRSDYRAAPSATSPSSGKSLAKSVSFRARMTSIVESTWGPFEETQTEEEAAKAAGGDAPPKHPPEGAALKMRWDDADDDRLPAVESVVIEDALTRECSSESEAEGEALPPPAPPPSSTPGPSPSPNGNTGHNGPTTVFRPPPPREANSPVQTKLRVQKVLGHASGAVEAELHEAPLADPRHDALLAVPDGGGPGNSWLPSPTKPLPLTAAGLMRYGSPFSGRNASPRPLRGRMPVSSLLATDGDQPPTKGFAEYVKSKRQQRDAANGRPPAVQLLRC